MPLVNPAAVCHGADKLMPGMQAEQAARRKAEELLAKSTESEASLKGQLEAEVKKRSKEQKQLAAQKEEVRRLTLDTK